MDRIKVGFVPAHRESLVKIGHPSCASDAWMSSLK